MKTPIQEFFEFMHQNQYFIGNDLLVKYKEMLEKEKGVINDAYIIGFSDRDIYHEAKDCYYIETFNTKEK